MQAKGGTTFFYIDDFFYWLGCKFVTCDKPNLRHDSLDSKKDKEKEKAAEQKSKVKNASKEKHEEKQAAPSKSIDLNRSTILKDYFPIVSSGYLICYSISSGHFWELMNF